MDIARDMFLVGDIFMRRFYTVFDRQNDRIGIAESATNHKIKELNRLEKAYKAGNLKI